MTMPVVTIPNSVLQTKAQTVKTFDKKLKQLIKEMEKTLIATKKPKGVGLAAPQIGEPYRVFITRPTAKDQIRSFINPEIVGYSNITNDNTQKENNENPLEGCLSIPEIWGSVTRAQSVTLRYQDSEGIVHEELIEGFLATIIQHETDHTNGILFTQRVIEQKGKFYKTEIDDKGKEYLQEITLP